MGEFLIAKIYGDISLYVCGNEESVNDYLLTQEDGDSQRSIVFSIQKWFYKDSNGFEKHIKRVENTYAKNSEDDVVSSKFKIIRV